MCSFAFGSGGELYFCDREILEACSGFEDVLERVRNEVHKLAPERTTAEIPGLLEAESKLILTTGGGVGVTWGSQ